MKSENLCRRVNSLADKLSSQTVSQDSCESVSPRLNLHIPRGAIVNTVLSPLSMGELDTDRISGKIEEVEFQIAQYDLLLKVWKSWKNWSIRQVHKRENKTIAEDFTKRKVLRKVFGCLKKRFLEKLKSQKTKILAQGSYVQKKLRKIITGFKKWVEKRREIKEVFSKTKKKRLKRVFLEWQRVHKELSVFGKKVRETRRKKNKKILFKYFKYFAITSLIIQKENQQKRIALDFNTERLLKIGYTHLKLSVFTNKYYNSLMKLAENHYLKTFKKKTLDLFYMNFLNLKRVRVVKSTGLRVFRKNHLIKAMRKFYSFCALAKKFREKTQESLSYYSSNLYLKTLVSWQSYHKSALLKKNIREKARTCYKKATLKKVFAGWKNWFPKSKKLRRAFESFSGDRKYWVMKEMLLEWVVLSKNRREKMLVFNGNKNRKLMKKFFEVIREFSAKRIEKSGRNEEKILNLSKNMLNRFFKGWKGFWQKRKGLKVKKEKIFILKKQKIYKKWRVFFLRKISLTPLVLKRNCLFIFKRWKKYSVRTSAKFSNMKKAKTHSAKRIKKTAFKRLALFFFKSKQCSKKISQFNKKKNSRVFEMIFNYWKSFTLVSRVKRLKNEESRKQFEFWQKVKVFSLLIENKKNQQETFNSLARQFASNMISLKQIKNPGGGKLNEKKPVFDLEKTLAKSKGLFRWYYFIKNTRDRENDISSILSHSIKLDVSDSYFNKQAVEAIQSRRQKTAKKILAFWRQFVDASRQKYKNALFCYKKSLMKKAKKIFIYLKDYSIGKKKSKTLLEAASASLSVYTKSVFFLKLKRFVDLKKLNKAKLKTGTKNRLSKYLGTILNYWRNYTKYKTTLKKMTKNFRSFKLYRIVLSSLKENLVSSSIFKGEKADNFFIYKFFCAWSTFPPSQRKIKRKKQILRKKADEFFNDLSCVRTLRRLKDHAYNRVLMKQANQVFFENSFRRVFSRWTSYHNRYLKIMRKAKIIESQKVNKQKSFCLKKWFYVSHLNSWKNRAEKRLFFYWDRRLKRILFTWKNVLSSKKDNFHKVWTFRSQKLKSKSLTCWKMQSQLNQQNLKQKASHDLIIKTSCLKKGFKMLKAYHEYSRHKLGKLTKALKFRYFKLCEKYLNSWNSTIKRLKSKKGKLKKLLNHYIRNFSVNKVQLKSSQISGISKTDLPKDFEFLLAFGSSLSSAASKGNSYILTSIFLKWRSIVGCKLIDSYYKAVEFNNDYLKIRCLRAWGNALMYAKNRRKTLRAAIIFHRTSLKKRMFYAWKPKKIIRRRNK